MRIDDVTPSWKSASVGKCNMQESYGLCWQYFMFVDYLRLSVQKSAPRGFIITKVRLILMDLGVMKGDYNQGIKARISVSKVIRP